jgi:hypothetical protein
MDRQNTRQVTEMRGAYRPVASSCLRTWMARDTNRYIRRKNRQCSGLVCRRVSRTLDAEWQNRRSSLTRLYDRSWPVGDLRLATAKVCFHEESRPCASLNSYKFREIRSGGSLWGRLLRVPATKIDTKNPAISMDCWVFISKVGPSPQQNQWLGFVGSNHPQPITECISAADERR